MRLSGQACNRKGMLYVLCCAEDAGLSTQVHIGSSRSSRKEKHSSPFVPTYLCSGYRPVLVLLEVGSKTIILQVYSVHDFYI